MIIRYITQFVNLLPDILAYLKKQKLWAFWGNNTWFVAGLIGMV